MTNLSVKEQPPQILTGAEIDVLRSMVDFNGMTYVTKLGDISVYAGLEELRLRGAVLRWRGVFSKEGVAVCVLSETGQAFRRLLE